MTTPRYGSDGLHIRIARHLRPVFDTDLG